MGLQANTKKKQMQYRVEKEKGGPCGPPENGFRRSEQMRALRLDSLYSFLGGVDALLLHQTGYYSLDIGLELAVVLEVRPALLNAIGQLIISGSLTVDR